ncbi:BA75_04101T0 [Komagataella pastoris]|uniref:separase n=1 Tax=Komagataella pastoris TaxID=4922 RepID=A0A1B2JF13_PICPA|nr:BA75_04101T0 [Komagataella pastoris]
MNRVNDHIKLLESYKRNEPTILADRTNTAGLSCPSLNLKSHTVTPFGLASMLVLKMPLDISGSSLKVQMYELAFEVLHNETGRMKRCEVEQLFKTRLVFAVKLMDKDQFESCYLQLMKTFVEIKRVLSVTSNDETPSVQQMIRSIPCTKEPAAFNGIIASFHTVLLQYIFKEKKVLITPDQLVESMCPNSNFWQWFHSLDKDSQTKRSPTLIKLFLSYTQYPTNVFVPVGSQICCLLITLMFSKFTNSVPLELILDNLHSTIDRLISGNRLEPIKRQCLPFLEAPQELLLDHPKYQSVLSVFGRPARIHLDQFTSQDSIQHFNTLINNLILSSKEDDATQDFSELESILTNSNLFSTTSIQNDSFIKHIYKLVSFIAYSDNAKYYEYLPIILKQFKANESLSLTTVIVEILDLIVRFTKSLDPTLHQELLYTLLTDVFKIFYKKLPDNLNEKFLSRIQDISNIFFQTGINVFDLSFEASLKHWMSSIELEYVILVQPETTQKNPLLRFESLKLKNDRIVHKLINNSSYLEAQEFISNSFKIYNNNILKSSPKLSFFQKERMFSKTLDISLKLLAKLIIKSLKLDLLLLSGGSSQLMTLIVGNLFNILASTSLVRKNEIIGYLVENYLLSNTDTGLAIYIAFQYFKIAGIDIQLFKLKPSVTIDKKSCLADYSHLFISFGLLIVCLQNRQVNQSLITKSFDSLLYWFQKKSLFVIENYEDDKSLLSLEFEILSCYVSYASYHGLFAYASTLIDVYKSERISLLSSSQQRLLDGKLFDIALELKSLEKANALLISNKKQAENFSCDLKTVDFLELLEWRLKEYHYLIIAGQTQEAETKFFYLIELFSQNEHLQLSSKSMTRVKLVQILILQSKLLWLSSILYTHSIPQQSYKLGRLSLKILQSLVKKFLPNLSNFTVHEFNDFKWQVSRLTMKVLEQLVNLFVCWSLTKQVEFYLNEYTKYLESHNFPVVFCYASYFMAEASLLAGNTSGASEFLVQADSIHEELQITDYLLDLSHLAAHGSYFMAIDEMDSATECYGKFCQMYDTMMCAKQLDHTTMEIKDMLSNGMLKQFRYFEGDQTLIKQMCTRFEVNLISYASPLKLEIINSFRSSHPMVNLAKKYHSDPLPANKAIIQQNGSSLGDNSTLKILIESCDSDSLFYMHHWKKLSDICMLLKNQFNESEDACNLLLGMNGYALSKTFKLDKDVAQLKEGPNQILPDTEDISVLRSQSSAYALDFNIVAKVQSNLFLNITVVEVDICSVTGDMLLSYFSSTEDLVITRIPFKSNVSWKVFRDQFNDIKDASAQTTNQERTANVKTKADRQDWWKERRELDSKLQNLLESFENDHLGALKGIFSSKNFGPNVLGKFSVDLKEILSCDIDRETGIFYSRLFLALGNPREWSSSDELNELIKYVTADKLLDVDGESLLIRNLLEEYYGNEQQPQDQHIILVPSKDCLEFPWESLPVLQTKSVSRMPSLEMLNELLVRSGKTQNSLKTDRVFYLLNPSGDLTRTKTTFKEKLESKAKWKGITDERPTESQFKEGLQNDLLIYLGHGSGQQYIKSKTIKKQNTCSSSLLIGCSSGALKGNNSLLEPYGPVFDYLIAGAPMVLVNMWDVTDKDIDKFTVGVCDFWGLFEPYPKEMNICEAVALSRNLCTLRFLNGSAPVVYGLPLYLTH